MVSVHCFLFEFNVMPVPRFYKTRLNVYAIGDSKISYLYFTPAVLSLLTYVYIKIPELSL